MKNLIHYQGYTGTVEFDEKENYLFGKVIGIRSSITYEGTNVEELLQDFHDGVDDYLNFCEDKNKTPEQPFRGTFNDRIHPYHHRQAAEYAIMHEMTLNHLVEESIQEKIAK